MRILDKRNLESEKILYKVMSFLYKSNLPIIFKGSLVLNAYFNNIGYCDIIRYSDDIDSIWITQQQCSTEEIVAKLQNILDKNAMNLDVSCFREISTISTAGFRFQKRNTDETLFKMDMQIDPQNIPYQTYEMCGYVFGGIIPIQFVAEKIAAISSDVLMRRVKDLFDLYYLKNAMDIDTAEFLQFLKDYNVKLGSFHVFFHKQNGLKAGYLKLKVSENVEKPDFDTLYETVKKYIEYLLPKEYFTTAEDINNYAEPNSNISKQTRDDME